MCMPLLPSSPPSLLSLHTLSLLHFKGKFIKVQESGYPGAGTEVSSGQKEGLGCLVERGQGMSTWTQLVWVLGDDLIQTGRRFRLDSEDKKGRPCQADHCYSKPWFSHSHFPALGMRASFILTFICSSDVHWTPSEILLRALGHVLGPQGYRTHSECFFWVIHHAECLYVFSFLTLIASFLCCIALFVALALPDRSYVSTVCPLCL